MHIHELKQENELLPREVEELRRWLEVKKLGQWQHGLHYPLGCGGDIADMANTAVNLVSPTACHVFDQVFAVDGAIPSITIHVRLAWNITGTFPYDEKAPHALYSTESQQPRPAG
ncbi:uncharacterized protein BXZ73DRAFT_105173 [Epithele typhae]|uniref:uncharacterized protein n=1 Tax=Epithele typhae TaxID=378194 RepID=UPI00200760D6|nr:uncharacterized protein BXZ73DRAFT_105173 [Epithele typhae]KAH9918533.1 hypothetical protein BXZ73DRAFT_105173 [Epithele typhae]